MATVAMNRPRPGSRTEPEWMVWALLALMLIIGLLARGAVEGRTESWSEGGVSLSYPADWVSFAREGQLLYVADSSDSAQFPASLSVQQLPVSEVGQNLTAPGDIALAWSSQRGRDLTAYRVLRTEPVTVNGQQAVRVEYAYVAEPLLGSATGIPPIVAQAQDILVQSGETLTVITMAANAAQWDELDGNWRAILGSIRAN